MRQAVRALGWATKIFWVVIAVFMITCSYSAMGLMIGGGIGLGELGISSSNGTVTVCLPFFINNTGLYDISELNITTRITDSNGTLISASTTFVPLVTPSSRVEKAHNVSISLNKLTSKNLTYLFFNDTNFHLKVLTSLKFAHIFSFNMSIISPPILWRAPLHNFSVREIKFIESNITLQISFDNHSPFNISGTMQIEIYNDKKELMGTSEPVGLDVESHGGYKDSLRIPVDPLKRTERGTIRFVFNTSIFSLEKEIEWVMPSD